MSINRPKSIGVLTSGGDAPGMNAAVRAVVRTALDQGADVYAIYEGYQGMVDGGERIRKMGWDSVGGILYQGGTIIGTARCEAFRTRSGRRQAARNLLAHGIDGLVIIGGDGSLTGANLFRQEWPDLLTELVTQGQISQETADRYPRLTIVGLVGSIDNDMWGTDMTIGADSALHRITEAVDAISSTAASHQRTFVVEVMGRGCGYLALMGALSSGADWVLIPESPPEIDDWETHMCEVLKAGREAGRRDSIVVVAEGARDRHGKPISCHYVREVLETRLDEDVRVTILGHVQRGGSPSAFDRYISTLLGHAAVQEILSSEAESESCLIGLRDNRITRLPLMPCVEQTYAASEAIANQNFEEAMNLRGSRFADTFRIFRTLIRALPHPPEPGQKRLRFAVLNAGAPAAGMNTAVRAAVRLGIDQGHIMLAVKNGFQGLIEGDIVEMAWMDVAGWGILGGSELGTNRKIPGGSDFYAIARNIEEYNIAGLLVIGGWAGYQAAYRLWQERLSFPAFSIPILCLPATINNNLPGSEISIGADTALNNIVEAVDKIKQSAVASRRCFVVEVMGRYCGYLALMSGLATGAERVYLPEEGITLGDLQNDLTRLVEGFRRGKRLGLIIRNENANPIYNTQFVASLFEEEGGDLFEVRHAILGHLQQGGNPTPFDRIQANRLAAKSITWLIDEAQAVAAKDKLEAANVFIGIQGGQVRFFNLEDLPRLADQARQRPKDQWWLGLRPVAKIMAKPGPG
jgi:6-phosphofructokinase 1